MPVGDGCRELEILLDQQNSEYLRLQRRDGFADLLDDHRRQSPGRLVKQQQPGAGAQNSRHRQHLLFDA